MQGSFTQEQFGDDSSKMIRQTGSFHHSQTISKTGQSLTLILAHTQSKQEAAKRKM